MDDPIKTQLADAGRLLRDWRDDHLDDLMSSDGVSLTGVRPLTLIEAPTPPSSRRRWVIGAAAALVVLVGAAGVVLANRGADNLPVASAPNVVAFVPGSLDEWDLVQVSGRETGELEAGSIVVARPGTDPADGQFVRLSTTQVDDPTYVTDLAGGGPIEVGSRSGWWLPQPSGESALLVTEPEGMGSALRAIVGANVSEDDLIDLVQAFDPALDLDGQSVPEGWTLEFNGADMVSTRSWQVRLLRRSQAEDDVRTVSITVVTYTGVEPRKVEWYSATSPTERVEVRGREAWLADHSVQDVPFSFLSWSLAWAEGPQTTVFPMISTDDLSLDIEAFLTDVAEGLVGLTAAELADFAVGLPSGSEATADEREAERRRQEQLEVEREARRQQLEAEQRFSER